MVNDELLHQLCVVFLIEEVHITVAVHTDVMDRYDGSKFVSWRSLSLDGDSKICYLGQR